VKRPLVLACAAASIALTGAAHAETANEVLAESLFKDGMQRFDKGDVAGACASFTESLRLDPKLGTLLNLALCHEKQGKTATAWHEYSTGAAWATQNGQKDRREFANQHAVTLEGQLSRVIIQLPPARELSSVEVDGEPLPEPRWYLPLYLDPGAHTIAVSAPGKYRETVKVNIPRDPTAQLVPIPKLRDQTKASAQPAPPKADGASPPPPPPPAPQSSARTIAGLIAGGMGIVGVGVGSAFGVMAIGRRNDVNAHCLGNLCDPTGVQAHSDAQTDALLSTIGFAVGGVGLVTGAVLLFTNVGGSETQQAKVEPYVGPRGAGVTGVF
jgi:hypothetical protein